MSVINRHTNFNYSGAGAAGALDRLSVQDMIRDYYANVNSISSALHSILGNTDNTIIVGGSASKGTGDTINLTRIKGIVKQSVEVPDSFAVVPPSKQAADALRIVDSESDKTNLAVTGGQVSINLYANATLNGSAINYIKIKFIEKDAGTRTKKESPSSWVYQLEPSYEIRIEPVAPSAYELCLSQFTGTVGGSFIFSSVNRSVEGVNIDKLTTNDIIINNYNNREQLGILKDYVNVTATVTGAIEIVLPNVNIGAKPTIVLRIQSIGANGITDAFLVITTHMHTHASGEFSPTICRVNILGEYKLSRKIRFGYRTISTITYPTILIGGITDVLNYPTIQIVSVHNAYQADLPPEWSDRANYLIEPVTAANDAALYTARAFTLLAGGEITPSMVGGDKLSLDNGAGYSMMHLEDGGLEIMSGVEEIGGSYYRKYANTSGYIWKHNNTANTISLYIIPDAAAVYPTAVTPTLVKTVDCTTGQTVYARKGIFGGGSDYTLMGSTENALNLGNKLIMTDDGVQGRVLFYSNMRRDSDGVYRSNGAGLCQVLAQDEYATRELKLIRFELSGGGNPTAANQTVVATETRTVIHSNGGTINGGDLTISGAGNTLILNGDKYIEGLVVYDDTGVNGPSFTVTIPGASATDVYLVQIHGQVQLGTTGTLGYIVIRQGGVSGTIKGYLYQNNETTGVNRTIHGAAFAIIVGSSFSIVGSVNGNGTTVLEQYTYMRIA